MYFCGEVEGYEDACAGESRDRSVPVCTCAEELRDRWYLFVLVLSIQKKSWVDSLFSSAIRVVNAWSIGVS